ncbi:hypothetical protein, partial [Leptolyngbya sp. FACHB-36]|uniref:hypothetical protein n=1 Tax=Leptolyngbya sp. FACHB-36 TaxID=2692808 RepID=UPI001A7ED857
MLRTKCVDRARVCYFYGVKPTGYGLINHSAGFKALMVDVNQPNRSSDQTTAQPLSGSLNRW